MRAIILGVLTVVVVVAVLVVLFVAAVVATQEGEILKDAPAATPDLGLPESAVQPGDIAAVRFGLTARGYRMREVDEVLARLAGELAARDERIAQLEQAVAELAEPVVVPEAATARAIGQDETWPPTTWPGTTEAVALHPVETAGLVVELASEPALRTQTVAADAGQVLAPLDDFPEVLPAEQVGGHLPEAASAEEPSPGTDPEWRPFKPWPADPPPHPPLGHPGEGFAEPDPTTGHHKPRVR